MADLGSITAVQPTANTSVSVVQFGGTVGLASPVYLDAATSKYKQCDTATAAEADVQGIAITAGASDEYGVVATSGNVTLVGTTMVIGESYVVSATAGNIAPEPDMGTGDYVARLGTASSATQLDLALKATGIQHA